METNEKQKQQPLFPAGVEEEIREREKKGEKIEIEQPPVPKKQGAMLPPFFTNPPKK